MGIEDRRSRLRLIISYQSTDEATRVFDIFNSKQKCGVKSVIVRVTNDSSWIICGLANHFLRVPQK